MQRFALWHVLVLVGGSVDVLGSMIFGGLIVPGQNCNIKKFGNNLKFINERWQQGMSDQTRSHF